MAKRTCVVDGCGKLSSNGAKLCAMHRARLSKYWTLELPPVQGPKQPCMVEGCSTPRRQNGVCMMHLYRMRRTGSYEARPLLPVGTTSVHSHGYIIEHQPGHVLARPLTAQLYQHRRVKFDEIGYGPHQCRYCSCHIHWGSGLEVDHVDTDRANNSPDNLVECCGPCNKRLIRQRRAA